MNAPRLRLVEVQCFERPYRLRMPFRFGVTTATHGRQAIVRARIRLSDGREGHGFAAEALGAKWFDKNLELTDEQNHHQLRKSIEFARRAYLDAPDGTAFALFADNYAGHVAACADAGLNPLIASYGPSLLDRAVLDALCRIEGISFYAALQANLPGIGEHEVVADLSGFDFGGMLAGLRPADGIDVRHTVGLVDPITAADQGEGDRVDDGLPETLQEVIETYGNRYLKIKVSGDRDADLDRLERIAAVAGTLSEPYFATLDGNEQFESAEAVAEFMAALSQRPSLRRLYDAILYVEQPIKRQVALSRPVGPVAAYKPVIIDESDGELSAFLQARELGYQGVSSKACKGIYKSILNLARCRLWNGGGQGERYFMSAEDLTVEPGIALQQDLALVNLLGLTHVERNAHHFIDGFGGRPSSEAETYLAAHPDLYAMQDGRPRLRIVDGRLRIASLDCPGFASLVEPELDAADPMPVADWPDRTEAGG